jgi:isopenicillin N synthase-like dioxygenase
MLVPRLDMSKFLRGNATERRIFADNLGKAFREIGFATLVNHGISPELIKSGYAVARELFAVPENILLKYETPENGHQTGYTPLQVEHAKDQSPEEGDLKRQWNIRRPLPPGHPRLTNPAYVANVWPTAEAPNFQPVALKMFAALDALSVEVLIALEMHLRYPLGKLLDMVRDGETLMRILHYPPINGTPKAVRSGAHEDINLVTFLIAGTEPGLQVKTRGGVWAAVGETADSIVVNVADMLQMLTNWELPSTTHRVVNPPDGANTDRYSWPFFVHLKGDTIVHPETGYTAAMYLRRRLWEIGMLPLDVEPTPPPTKK